MICGNTMGAGRGYQEQMLKMILEITVAVFPSFQALEHILFHQEIETETLSSSVAKISSQVS